MTYAEHQEAACQALVKLLQDQRRPDPDALPEILLSREQILMTVAERMNHLGAGRASAGPSSSYRVAKVVESPLQELVRLHGELPKIDTAGHAPSDVLAVSERDAVDRSPAFWRTAARESFLATSELTRSEHQPWHQHPAAGWHLIGDLADVVEAVTALDSDLCSIGALPATAPNRLLTRQLVAGHVARLAHAFGTDQTADLATAGWGSESAEDGPRIRMVRVPEDFALAQRRLAGFVRAHNITWDPSASEDRVGLRAARVIAAGQVRLSMTFAGWADNVPGADGAAEGFRSRISLYRTLHASTARLVDLEVNRSPLPLIQQSEMVSQMRVLEGRGLSRAGLYELNDASREVAAHLGTALRREAYDRQRIQRIESRGVALRQPEPITGTREPFVAACRALAHLSPPPDVASAAPDSTHRVALRHALQSRTMPTRRTYRSVQPGGR